jgi:hypothetical protein
MKSLFSDIKYNKPWQLFFACIVTGIITVCGLSTSIKAAEIDFPFYPGEKLTFQLRWSLIPAGKAVLEVLPMETINGIKSYHFVMTAKTNSFVDLFYKFRSRIDAYTDIEMTHSILYKKKEHVRNKKKDVVVNFNWEKNKAIYSTSKKKRKPIDILHGSFDPFSAFYYTRLFDPNKNAIIERPVTDGKRCVIGKVSVIKRETIKVAGKTYDTYLIEPDLKHVGGVFEKSKDAKIQLWVTADKRRIPVQIKSKVVVGSFVGELVSAIGLKKG